MANAAGNIRRSDASDNGALSPHIRAVIPWVDPTATVDNPSVDALPQAVTTVRHGELAPHVRPPPQSAREILRDCFEVGPSRPNQRD